MRSRWWGIGLALLLIVAAAPARQVEAASDLARTVAEIGEPGRCEEVDGGVGDDPLEAARPEALAWSDAPTVDLGPAGCLPSPLELAPPHWPTAGRHDAAPRSAFASPAARLAWLQRFLF